ncbi:MAG: LysR substrate-binding domain-containing protein [Moraxella sp.]|nr:LysR substrate-binding domain-containing protein [Moraxella sp.]
MIERLSLNALKFFYFCALYGSVTLAAEKLCLTQGAVSKQIKNLEAALHTKLFVKTGRKLVLTAQGEVLFRCCEQVFGQLRECLDSLAHTDNTHRQLVLSCEPTISMKWLIPRLVEFHRLHQDIEIVLLTGGGQVDFAEKNIDLAIRRNDFEWHEDLYAVKLAGEYIAVVGRQEQAINHQPKLILSASRADLWKRLNMHKLVNKQTLQYEKIVLEHFYLCIEAALANLGVSVVSAYMVEKEINSGVLKYISAPVADGSAYYLLSRGGFDKDERKAVFKAWLKAEFMASERRILA